MIVKGMIVDADDLSTSVCISLSKDFVDSCSDEEKIDEEKIGEAINELPARPILVELSVFDTLCLTVFLQSFLKLSEDCDKKHLALQRFVEEAKDAMAIGCPEIDTLATLESNFASVTLDRSFKSLDTEHAILLATIHKTNDDMKQFIKGVSNEYSPKIWQAFKQKVLANNTSVSPSIVLETIAHLEAIIERNRNLISKKD